MSFPPARGWKVDTGLVEFSPDIPLPKGLFTSLHGLVEMVKSRRQSLGTPQDIATSMHMGEQKVQVPGVENSRHPSRICQSTQTEPLLRFGDPWTVSLLEKVLRVWST